MKIFGPANGDIILRIYNREKGKVRLGGDPSLFLKGIMTLLNGFYRDFESNEEDLRSDKAFIHDVNIVITSEYLGLLFLNSLFCLGLLYFMKYMK